MNFLYDLSLMIAKKRLEKGLTVRQLSDLSGNSDSTIRHLESGEHINLNLSTLINFARVLGWEIIDMLKPKEFRNPQGPPVLNEYEKEFCELKEADQRFLMNHWHNLKSDYIDNHQEV